MRCKKNLINIFFENVLENVFFLNLFVINVCVKRSRLLNVKFCTVSNIQLLMFYRKTN